ncbi:hypothetical protein [Dankookia sp. P2]|uniref:hypothetical protein n=1 Tax=Dankookia sp. P2 TaxID=3423955 RepID=UPI003D66F4CA
MATRTTFPPASRRPPCLVRHEFGRDRPAARRRAAFPWTALCLGLGALAAAVLVLAPYPPLQDFPEWAYQGQLLARLLRGLPVDGVVLATTPVPNSSVQLLLGLLSLAMPAALAARLFLLGLVGASVAVALALGRRYQPGAPGAFAALLLVAVFLNAAFWNGYANFQLGMVLLGAWFLLPEARRARVLPIMGFGLAIFFTHAMVFFAFCALLGATALLDPRRIIPTAAGLLPAAVLTGWYVATNAGGNATETSGTGGPAAFLAYKLYTVAKLGPYHNFVFAGGATSSPARRSTGRERRSTWPSRPGSWRCWASGCGRRSARAGWLGRRCWPPRGCWRCSPRCPTWCRTW